MKIKSLIATILVLVLCLSCFLVSCTPKDKEPEINSDPESDKQVISDKLSEGSIGDVFEKLESEETTIDLSTLYEEIVKIAFSGELDLNTEWIDSTLILNMKDGIVEAKLPERSYYAVLDEDMSVTTLTGYPYSEGYWISSEEMIPSDIELPSDDQSFEEALGLSTEALEILKSFSFPAIDVDDIAFNGDWYIIPDEYYGEIAKSVLDLIVEISELEGEDTPTEEEYNEALDQITKIVDALGLEIGFAVAGENIVGIKVSVDVDTEKMYEIEDDMIATPYLASDEENEAESEKLEATVEMWLTDDALFLSSVKISLDVAMDDMYAKGELSYKYTYENAMLSGVSLEADIELAEDEDEIITAKGNISASLIFDENEICGVSVNADMDITNAPIGGDYYETNNGTYGEYVTCIGDVNVDASFVIDLSKVSEVGEDIVSADIDCEVTGKSLYYYTYDDTTYESVKSSDMSVFKDAPELSDFSSMIDIYGYATVDAENVIDISFIVAMDEDVSVDVSGTLALDSAEDITLPDGLDADTLAEDYARIKLEAEKIADEIEYDYTTLILDGYYIHDAESGLYAYISVYGFVEYIGTVKPDNDHLINDCGVYIEYTK